MRRIHTFIVMVLLVSLFLVFFYSTLHLETTYGHRAGAEDLLRHADPQVLQVQERDVKTATPKPESFTGAGRFKKPDNVTKPEVVAKPQVVTRPQVVAKPQVVTKPQVFTKSKSVTKTKNVTKTESVTTPQPEVYNVSVSNGLRQTITPNSAYWNRLLYSALRNLDNGGKTFRRAPDWSHCKDRNVEGLQTNVHDFRSYPHLFQDFMKGMNCRSPPVLINQPNKCISGKGKSVNETLFLFAIKSSPGNFERRQAVRETWGREGTHQNGLEVRTVFLLGSPLPDDPDFGPLLSFEARHFGDILQWDFNESLLNLTLKMSIFLEWTMKYCPHVSFVFSGDDDVFVNSPALLRHLQSLEPSEASRLYLGHIIATATPQRDDTSKYYVPLSFYDGSYPAYAGGGGFVISGALLQPVYSVSQVIPFFPIDDVYTGMCVSAVGVSPQAHPGFKTFDVKEQDRENMCIHKNLILTHQRSPQQLKRLWKGIHSPFLTC